MHQASPLAFHCGDSFEDAPSMDFESHHREPEDQWGLMGTVLFSSHGYETMVIVCDMYFAMKKSWPDDALI